MKKITKISAVIATIALLSMTMYGCIFNRQQDPIATAENPFALQGLGVRPAGAKSITRNVDVEGQDAINLAVELYEIGCDNDKLTDHRAFFSVCPTSNLAAGMDNKILLNILEVKNGTEYYRVDYRLRDSVPLFDLIPESTINKAVKLVTTERRYMNTSMDYTRYQQILNAMTDENGVPYADWSNKAKIDEKTNPNEGPSKPKIFNKDQDGIYRKSDHTIETDTITEATVTYNETEGFYSVIIKLDCSFDGNGFNKATQNTRPLIQDGAGAPNAKYDEITIEFELWDNGYFKTFKSTEHWSATKKIVLDLEIVSTFYYTDVYSYDVRDCNIAKYYKDGNFIDDYNAAE